MKYCVSGAGLVAEGGADLSDEASIVPVVGAEPFARRGDFLDATRHPAEAKRDSPTAGKALGYAQLLAVMDDHGVVVDALGTAVEATVRATRRFVRRQRSWFRRDPRVHWLDGAAPDLVDRALTLD